MGTEQFYDDERVGGSQHIQLGLSVGMFRMGFGSAFWPNLRIKLRLQFQLRVVLLSTHFGLMIYTNMKLILSLLFLLALGLAQVQLGSGEVLEVPCVSSGQILYFKTMREFSIISIDKVDGITLESNDTKCSFTGASSSICTFQNFTKQVNVSCSSNSNEGFHLSIQKPNIIGHKEQINATFVAVHLNETEEAILGMQMDPLIAEEIYRLGKNWKNLVYHSNCIKDMVAFQDQIRFALKKANTTCTVGLNNAYQWILEKTQSQFTKLTQETHRGYLQNGMAKKYTLPDEDNLTLTFIFETEDPKEIEQNAIIFSVNSPNGNVERFTAYNFEKGVYEGVQTRIFLNKSVESIEFLSNASMFYAFTFRNTENRKLFINENQYLYLHLEKDVATEFIVELETFQEQALHAQTIYLHQRLNASLTASYLECSTPECNNLTGSPITIVNNQFTPNCSQLIKGKCILSIKVKAPQTRYFGLILLAYNKEISMEPNTIHTGILERERTYRYVVKKEHMLNSTTEVIVVNVKGAKAYLTYDPNCKILACTKYWDASGSIEIPKQNLDLFVFLVGSGHEHYTIMISTKKSVHVLMPEGLLLKGRLSPVESKKYYIYKPKDTSKSFQINCNALPGSVLLLMNIKSDSFPTKDNATKSSKDCYIYVSPQQYTKDDKIHITIERLTEEHKQINFNLIGMTQGTELFLEWGEPYYDYFQPSSQKVLKFFINSAHSQQVFFKIDIFDQSFSKPVQVQVIGLEARKEYNVTVSNVETFILNLEDQKLLCKDQAVEKCYLAVRVLNPGEYGVEASITTWFRKEPLKLQIGEFANFQTGSLGQDTFFYIPIEDRTKPINVYAYSTHVELEVIGVLDNQDTSLMESTRVWPFPRFAALTAEQEAQISFSFSSYLYFGAQQLQTAVPGAAILLTVRDRSTADNKSIEALSSLGIIQFAASTGHLKLRQNDRFQYILQKDETYYFEFPLSGHHIKNRKLEVYFHNQALTGNSQITYYFSNQKFEEKHAIFQPTDFISVKLDDFRKRHPSITATDSIGIVFVVRTQTAMSKLLATVATSTTDYRELTLGVPEQFYIPMHSSSIFQFADFYNQDFKVKIHREDGFPEYKLISCGQNESKVKCLDSLNPKNKVNNKDDETLVVSGRTHELKIDSKSEHYCKDCVYYIALYSHDEEIFGSLTVTRPGQSVLLRESHPLTTEVSSDDFDTYVVTSLPTTSRQVSIVPHMGHIKVESYQLLEQNPDETVFNVQNSTDGSSINLHIQKSTTVVPFNIKVTSLDQENAMYSIVLSSSSDVVKLVNGIPFKVNFKSESILTLEFAPEGNSTVLVSATDKISIDLTCQSNQSKIISRNKNIKHSEIFNTSLLHFSSSECEIYEIEISNEKPLKLTVLANTEEIVLLPFGLVVPSVIKPNQTQIYEIPVQQKTHLKIVFKLCQSGHAHVAIYSSKDKLAKSKHNVTFEISGDRSMEVFDYNASAGILYLEVESSADVLEYTIQVYPILRESIEKTTAKTLLNDTYIDTIQVSPGRFNIEFEPFKIIENQLNYTVSYVIIESTQRSYLRKSLRCSGTFFDVKNPNTQFKETNLVVEKLADGSLRAPYSTSYDKSYVTIVPVVTPPLPSFTHLVSYDISELSTGKGPQLIQRMISKMLAVIEAVTGIQDENMLNFALILVIVVFNVFVVTVCCWISARHCRRTIVIERKRLATSEREGRLTRVENSLDMLDVVEEEATQREISTQ